jgi:hypothetical protein
VKFRFIWESGIACRKFGELMKNKLKWTSGKQIAHHNTPVNVKEFQINLLLFEAVTPISSG